MGQVERFGEWVLNGASWGGVYYSIPKSASMHQDVDLTGVAAITFQYWSCTETWSHLICYVDDVEVFNQKRSTNMIASRSIAVDYTGVHRVRFMAINDMSASCCLRKLSALATVANLALSQVTFSHKQNHGPSRLSLTGSGFLSDMVVKLKRDGHPDLVCTVEQVSETSALCTADLFALAPGQWKVSIESGGQAIESGESYEIYRSLFYPAMALKRGKVDNYPTDMSYTVDGVRVKIRGMK